MFNLRPDHDGVSRTSDAVVVSNITLSSVLDATVLIRHIDLGLAGMILDYHDSWSLSSSLCCVSA